MRHQVAAAGVRSQAGAEAIATEAIQPMLARLEQLAERQKLWLAEHKLRAWQEAATDIRALDG